MKKIIIILLIIAGIIVASLLWKPTIKIGQIKNIQVENIQMDNIKLNLLLPVKNSNSMSITLKKVNLIFFINGVKAGKVNLSKEVKIPAHSEKDLNFPIEIRMQEMLNNFIGLLSSISMDKAEIQLKGTFTVKAFIFTKEIDVDKLNIVPLKK